MKDIVIVMQGVTFLSLLAQRIKNFVYWVVVLVDYSKLFGEFYIEFKIG